MGRGVWSRSATLVPLQRVRQGRGVMQRGLKKRHPQANASMLNEWMGVDWNPDLRNGNRGVGGAYIARHASIMRRRLHAYLRTRREMMKWQALKTETLSYFLKFIVLLLDIAAWNFFFFWRQSSLARRHLIFYSRLPIKHTVRCHALMWLM